MQSISQSVAVHSAVALVMDEDVLSVRPGASVEDVVALLTGHQTPAVAVIDECGVPVGVISLADLVGHGDGDPIFAGLARRRWYHQPAGITAGDLMTGVMPAVGCDGERERSTAPLALSEQRYRLADLAAAS